MKPKPSNWKNYLLPNSQKVAFTAASPVSSVMKAGYKGAVRSSALVVNHKRKHHVFTPNTNPGQFTCVLLSPETYAFTPGYL